MGWFNKPSAAAPPSPSETLWSAVQALSPDAVALALAQGAPAMGPSDAPITPLLSALTHFNGTLPQGQAAQKAIVQALLTAGALPAVGGTQGQNPLEVALKRGQLALVELLLSAGHDPNQGEAMGPTPLQTLWLLLERRPPALAALTRALLRAGASPLLARRQPIPLRLALAKASVWTPGRDAQDALMALLEGGALPPEDPALWVEVNGLASTLGWQQASDWLAAHPSIPSDPSA